MMVADPPKMEKGRKRGLCPMDELFCTLLLKSPLAPTLPNPFYAFSPHFSFLFQHRLNVRASDG